MSVILAFKFSAYAFHPYHFALIINKICKICVGEEESGASVQHVVSWDFAERNMLSSQDDLPLRVSLCSPVRCITQLLHLSAFSN